MKDTKKRLFYFQNKKRELFDQMIEHKIDIEKLDSDDYKFILSESKFQDKYNMFNNK